MQIRKVNKILMAAALMALLVTGCSSPASGSSSSSENTEKTDNNGKTEINKKDYKFKVSALPYDSIGLTIYVKMTSSKYEDVKEEIGKITSVAKDAVVEKTIQLPDEYDQMILFFIDENNKTRYSTKLKSEYFYKDETDIWDIDGYYYYYYESAYNSKNPYAATDETKIKDLTLNTKYNFDASTAPYHIWKVENVNDKLLKFDIEDSSKVDVHISSNKDDLMTYKVKALTGNFYECTAQTVYIMLKPKEYIFG